jgi:dolichol-phosphate mannosyltransferase
LKNKFRTIIVLPIYNEFANIEKVYKRIRDISDSDILFIDDGSTDGSLELLEEIKLNDPYVYCIYRGAKLGLGSAYRDAYRYATENAYKYLIQCDADGSHQIEIIPKMLNVAKGGVDLVIGSRYVSGGSVQGWAKSRIVISKLGNFYSRICLNLKTKDNTAGFRIYDVSTLSRIDYGSASANGYAFQVQMTYLFRKVKVVEVPIKFTEREFGESKMTTQIALEALIQIPLLRFRSSKRKNAIQL